MVKNDNGKYKFREEEKPKESEMDMQMESIAAQYIPDFIYSDRSNHNEFADNNFLFNQLE